jgi:hypothetical protein
MSEATEAWEKAAELSHKLQYEAGERAMLERLSTLYKQTGHDEKLRACEKALSKLLSR